MLTFIRRLVFVERCGIVERKTQKIGIGRIEDTGEQFFGVVRYEFGQFQILAGRRWGLQCFYEKVILQHLYRMHFDSYQRSKPIPVNPYTQHPVSVQYSQHLNKLGQMRPLPQGNPIVFNRPPNVYTESVMDRPPSSINNILNDSRRMPMQQARTTNCYGYLPNGQVNMSNHSANYYLSHQKNSENRYNTYSPTKNNYLPGLEEPQAYKLSNRRTQEIGQNRANDQLKEIKMGQTIYRQTIDFVSPYNSSKNINIHGIQGNNSFFNQNQKNHREYSELNFSTIEEPSQQGKQLNLPSSRVNTNTSNFTDNYYKVQKYQKKDYEKEKLKTYQNTPSTKNYQENSSRQSTVFTTNDFSGKKSTANLDFLSKRQLYGNKQSEVSERNIEKYKNEDKSQAQQKQKFKNSYLKDLLIQKNARNQDKKQYQTKITQLQKQGQQKQKIINEKNIELNEKNKIIIDKNKEIQNLLAQIRQKQGEFHSRQTQWLESDKSKTLKILELEHLVNQASKKMNKITQNSDKLSDFSKKQKIWWQKEEEYKKSIRELEYSSHEYQKKYNQLQNSSAQQKKRYKYQLQQKIKVIQECESKNSLLKAKIGNLESSSLKVEMDREEFRRKIEGCQYQIKKLKDQIKISNEKVSQSQKKIAKISIEKEDEIHNLIKQHQHKIKLIYQQQSKEKQHLNEKTQSLLDKNAKLQEKVQQFQVKLARVSQMSSNEDKLKISQLKIQALEQKHKELNTNLCSTEQKFIQSQQRYRQITMLVVPFDQASSKNHKFITQKLKEMLQRPKNENAIPIPSQELQAQKSHIEHLEKRNVQMNRQIKKMGNKIGLMTNDINESYKLIQDTNNLVLVLQLHEINKKFQQTKV